MGGVGGVGGVGGGGVVWVGGGVTGMRSVVVASTSTCVVSGTGARVAVVSEGGSDVVSLLPLEQLARIKTLAASKKAERISCRTSKCYTRASMMFSRCFRAEGLSVPDPRK